MLVKKCKMCKKTLPIDNFFLTGVGKKGQPFTRGKCKSCETEYRRKREGTWEKYKKEKAYVKELHSLQKEGKRRCRKCNIIKILDEFGNDFKSKVYYKKSSTCKKCAYENWRVPYTKTEHFKKLKSGYAKQDFQKRKEKIYEYIKEKYHDDVQFKLRNNLRSRLGSILRAKNVKKTKSALKLVGCDIEFLKKYLESKFKDGMTWDNWSRYGWHIDHIIPLDSFDLNNLEEQKKAMHYTNLQPLWSEENWKKGNKF